MFWTDWGSLAKIERAFLDGTHRKVLVDVGLGKLDLNFIILHFTQ